LGPRDTVCFATTSHPEISVRVSRFLFGVIAALVFALIPLTGDAAAYRRYSSKVCPYSVEYPKTWSVRNQPKADTFYYHASSEQFGQMQFSCAFGKTKISIRKLTEAVANAYVKQGYRLTAPAYKLGQLGRFLGTTTFKANGKSHVERIHVSTLLLNGRAWVMGLAADSNDFAVGEQIYTHALSTFKPH
jgi:hypothetical protein